MPLRRKECAGCGERFRVLEPTGVEQDGTCPACGCRETRRFLPRVAVQFRGSGFYRTDHARDGAKRAADAGEGEGGSEAPSAGGDPTSP
jgi:putative FmdB family regulatory protein